MGVCLVLILAGSILVLKIKNVCYGEDGMYLVIG